MNGQTLTATAPKLPPETAPEAPPKTAPEAAPESAAQMPPLPTQPPTAIMAKAAPTAATSLATSSNLINERRAAELAAFYCKSPELIPKDYKTSNAPNVSMVATAILWGGKLGLDPMASLNGIAVVNGRPSLFGETAMAVLRSSGLVASIARAYHGQEPQPGQEFPDDYCCRVTCRRVDSDQDAVYEFSVADAKRAGLWKKTGPWTQYPKDMLFWRAFGRARKQEFPDAFAGLALREEQEDIIRVQSAPPEPSHYVHALGTTVPCDGREYTVLKSLVDSDRLTEAGQLRQAWIDNKALIAWLQQHEPERHQALTVAYEARIDDLDGIRQPEPDPEPPETPESPETPEPNATSSEQEAA